MNDILDRLATLVGLHTCTACGHHVVDLSEHYENEHGEDIS